MKLIFIHGRDQQGEDPQMLEQQWRTALEIGLTRAGLALPVNTEIAFPFYGNRLAELIKTIDTPLVSGVVPKGTVASKQEAALEGELLYEMALHAGITDADVQAQYSGLPQEKGPLNWEWVQALLRALDRTPMGGSIIKRVTRDVSVYLTYKAVRTAIDSLVNAVFVDNGPYVVVGHSLGSVVGYNVLHKLPVTVDVRAYITVGSPLGIKAIKQQLDIPLAMPASVQTWYNAMDEKDYVALYPLDGNHFPIKPLITNKQDVDNHTDNRHGIDGYLDDPEVASAIYQALQDKYTAPLKPDHFVK